MAKREGDGAFNFFLLMMLIAACIIVAGLALSGCASPYQWAHWHKPPMIIVHGGVSLEAVETAAKKVGGFGEIVKVAGLGVAASENFVKVGCGPNSRTRVTAYRGHMINADVEIRCSVDGYKWLEHELEHALGYTRGEIFYEGPIVK